FLTSNVAANCVFLEIAAINNATVDRGVTAAFPIAVRNAGASAQLVSLGGSCASEIDCSFDSSSATLAAGETRVFTLSAGTQRASLAYYEIPVSITAAAGGGSACDYRTAFLFVNQPAPSATPAPGANFDASLSPAGVVSSGRPGEVLAYEIAVSNNNDAKGFVKIRAEGVFASTTLFSTTNFDLAGGASKRVTARVRLPPGTPGGSYEIVFRVQATDGSSGEIQEFSLPAAIFVFSDTVDLDLLNQPVECLQVKQEHEFVFPLELRNNGEATGPFAIGIDAPADVKKFVRIEPSLLEIDSGDQQPLSVRIAPSSLATVASYNFNLVVKYLDYTVISAPLCVNISGVTGFFVEKADEYAVKRGVVTPLRIMITNNGSVSDDYSVEPAVVSWLSSQAMPSSFTLSPHESRDVNVVVTTTLDKTPLGVRFLPVVVRSTQTMKSELYVLKLRISSATQQGSSYLAIKKTRFTVLAGSQLEDSIEVVNSKDASLHGVSLTISGAGVSSAWYEISPAAQDIPAKSMAEYTLDWNVPKSKAGVYAVTLYAESSEGEATSANATLEVIAPQTGFSSSVSDVDYSKFESVGEITVTVVLKNTGNTSVSGITAVAPQGFVFSQPLSTVSLAPGEEKTVSLSLKPLASVPPEGFQLAFQSSEGVVAPAVTVFAAPAQNKTNGGSWLLYAVAALLLLVAVTAYYFNKEARGRRGARERGSEYESEGEGEGARETKPRGHRFTQKKLA
ncbi:MAG: hypothetical protein V1817_00030, partial [Candidatus Micrarchaeota archaeon]